MADSSGRGSKFLIERVPFPVTAPFRMQPGLTRITDSLGMVLGADSPDALRNSQCAVQRAVRLKRLPLLAASQADDHLLLELSCALTQMQASLSCADNGLDNGPNNGPATATVDRKQLLDQSQVLRAAMQDDFILMTGTGARSTDGPGLRASLMAVAMPSGWDPDEKLGQDFLELHQPVADAEMIRRAAPSLCAMMRAPGALRRYVWTLANSGDLSRHPDDLAGNAATSLEQIWFRCERQTSYSLLNGKVVLFVIRVYVESLTDVLAAEPARANTLLAALTSMSPTVIAYKSLQQIQPLVVRALNAQGGSSSSGACE